MYNIEYAGKLGDRINQLEANVKVLKKKLSYKCIKNGVVLPRKLVEIESKRLPYQGLGGVVDEQRQIVKESYHFDLLNEEQQQQKYAFGGFYEFKTEKVENVVAIYMGLANKHWGHFLIDIVQRAWILNEIENYIGTREYKFVFCGTEERRKKFGGNYDDFFKMVGIDVQKIEIVNSPTQFTEVIVPEVSIYPGEWITEEYRDIFQKVIHSAMEEINISTMPNYEKVYFSRLHLNDNKEIGEQSIENLMRRCGYTVLYPEELSLKEQIYYWQTAKQIACVNGTIPHNCVFANKNLQLFIFTKMERIVGYQFTMDKVQNIRPVYINSHREPFNRYPLSVSRGPFWVTITENVEKFVKNMYGEKIEETKSKKEILQYLQMCMVIEIKYHLRGGRVWARKFKNRLKKTL